MHNVAAIPVLTVGLVQFEIMPEERVACDSIREPGPRIPHPTSRVLREMLAKRLGSLAPNPAFMGTST